MGLMDHFRPRGVYGFPPFRTHRERHYSILAYRGFPFHLEMLNRAAAAFGLEYRHPFFDKRLVEFCLALPPEQKFNRGLTRPIMRRGLRAALPDEVYRRPDKGVLLHPYQYHVLTHGPSPLCDTILHQVEGLHRYVDKAVWRKVFSRYCTRGSTHQSGVVWSIATLALWLYRLEAQLDHGDDT
jgi:asparagine synthase (glutamine-hydrolysing)